MTALTQGARGAVFPFRLGLCALLMILADFLFYGHEIGWTMGLFCFAVLCASAICDPAALKGRGGAVLFILCLALCAGMVETDNLMTLLLFWVFFAALFTGMRLEEAPGNWRRRLVGLALKVVGGAAIGDTLTAYAVGRREPGTAFLPSFLAGWLLPVAISVVFVSLFTRANPVIGTWVASLDWGTIKAFLAPARIGFWLMTGVMIWGLLRAGRLRAKELSPLRQGENAPSPFLTFLFSRQAVTRSLLIANALFLTQNLLDANFLWAGAELPPGVTYAEYAHRGAYPLIVTALLAAAFVLIAMREKGGLKGDRLIRGLIYLWLAQNLLLVTSSIWRTYLYVSEYSLTYLRLAALLWMGLVMVGLMLIVVRILRDLPSSWLIKANLFAGLALLLATCPVDMGRFIAEYNVAHVAANGWPPRLDVTYLRDIGPSALPALRRLEKQTDQPASTELGRIIDDLSKRLEAEQDNWRRWTFRGYRLKRELASQPTP